MRASASGVKSSSAPGSTAPGVPLLSPSLVPVVEPVPPLDVPSAAAVDEPEVETSDVVASAVVDPALVLDPELLPSVVDVTGVSSPLQARASSRAAMPRSRVERLIMSTKLGSLAETQATTSAAPQTGAKGAAQLPWVTAVGDCRG